MTSVLPFIKGSYYEQVPQPINQKQTFIQQNIQRCGKQFISIMVSSSLIKSQLFATNRDVTSSFKRFEQQLLKKMRVSRKQAYKIFGNYCLQQLTLSDDQKGLQLELARMFFKEYNIVSKAKAQPISNFKKTFNKVQNNAWNTSWCGSIQGSIRIGTTEIGTKLSYFHQPTPQLTINPKQIQLPAKPTKSIYSDNISTQPSTIKGSISTRTGQTKYTSQQQNYYKSNKPINDDGFTFQQTQKDIQKKNIDFSCENYFIDVVGYLLMLPSPQGELTYIWQHLKWQGFQTFYQPFMNQALEWTCTARIVFPQNMYPQKSMQRSQKSKNKKKARQMACMQLLKSLYLQYPQVWMLYKHLKQEKRLVIAAVDQPKDQEQIALIKNRDKYVLNKEKIQKLFKHNKTDIRELMQRISAKAQLNTLLQQLPGRVTSPKLQKKPVQGNWLVPVRIQYKTYNDIQNNRLPKVYQKSITYHNTKIAQEQAYMQAIIEMYQKNPQLFQKIQSIKLAKGIREPEKKLPLMKALKEVARQY